MRGKNAKRRGGSIGIRHWNMPSLGGFTDGLNAAVDRAIDEAIETAFKKYRCYVRISPERLFTGNNKRDPSIFDIHLPFDTDDSALNGPCFEISIFRIVKLFVLGYVTPDRRVVDSRHVVGFTRLRDRLLEAANTIDEILPK